MATQQVPRSGRSRLFWILMAVAISAGALVLTYVLSIVHYRDAHLDFCDSCGSRRLQEQHRFRRADGPSWFGKEDTERIEESQVMKDWFAPGHTHEWVRAWTERDDGFAGFRSTGWGRNTSLRLQYERSPAFRRFLKEQVDGGTLLAEDVRLLLRQPPTTFRAGVEVAAPLKEGEVERLRRALEIVGKWVPPKGEAPVTELQSLTDRQPPK